MEILGLAVPAVNADRGGVGPVAKVSRPVITRSWWAVFDVASGVREAPNPMKIDRIYRDTEYGHGPTCGVVS